MATGIPDPDQTPDGPAYEGRLLDRPDEEVVDQGPAFDVRTLMTRRAVLGLAGLGVGATVLAACTSTASTATSSSTPTTTTTPSETTTPTPSASTTTLPSAEIPDETAGPYPGDGSNGPDVLAESGIERADIRSSIGVDDPVPGVPLDFTLSITDMANGDAAFAGVAVYAWHCDAQGRYSMYSEGVEDESWLRGVQVADAEGRVTFTSIVPGCYTGRWTHIHFEVYPDLASIDDAGNAIATSQLAFPQDVLDEVYQLSDYDGSAQNLAQISLESDNVFGEDSAALQMATISGDATSGYAASLVVRVDTTTEPTSGAAPGGPGRRRTRPALTDPDPYTPISRSPTMLQGLTGWHALVVLAVILLVFGATRLPALARSVGQSVSILKREVAEPASRTEPDAPSDAAAPAASTAARP